MMEQCPAWKGDIPAEKADRFANSVRQLYRSICILAPGGILDASDLLSWHKRLFHDLVPREYYAGNFRQMHPELVCLQAVVWVQDENATRVYGTDYNLVPDAMMIAMMVFKRRVTNLELNWDELAPETRIKSLSFILARLIADFIRIHPFLNGNGRVSRLIWAWGLVRFGIPPQCRIHPRPDRESTAYGTLMAEAMKGNYTPLAGAILGYISGHAENTPSRPTH